MTMTANTHLDCYKAQVKVSLNFIFSFTLYASSRSSQTDVAICDVSSGSTLFIHVSNFIVVLFQSIITFDFLCVHMIVLEV